MTIGGHHTYAETRDLLAVADYRFAEVEKAFGEARAHPAPDQGQLELDWSALKSEWEAARRDVRLRMIAKAAALPFVVSEDMVPTEDEYQRVLGFVQYQELDPKSLQGITRRVEKQLGRPILFENQPKQNARDEDLAILKEADAAVKQAEASAHAVKEAATSRTALAIGGTVLAGGLLLAFYPEARLALDALRRAPRPAQIAVGLAAAGALVYAFTTISSDDGG